MRIFTWYRLQLCMAHTEEETRRKKTPNENKRAGANSQSQNTKKNIGEKTLTEFGYYTACTVHCRCDKYKRLRTSQSAKTSAPIDLYLGFVFGFHFFFFQNTKLIVFASSLRLQMLVLIAKIGKTVGEMLFSIVMHRRPRCINKKLKTATHAITKLKFI